jgi:hypothetical protein
MLELIERFKILCYIAKGAPKHPGSSTLPRVLVISLMGVCGKRVARLLRHMLVVQVLFKASGIPINSVLPSLPPSAINLVCRADTNFKLL